MTEPTETTETTAPVEPVETGLTPLPADPCDWTGGLNLRVILRSGGSLTGVLAAPGTVLYDDGTICSLPVGVYTIPWHNVAWCEPAP